MNRAIQAFSLCIWAFCAGCSDDDDDNGAGGGGAPPPPSGDPLSVYVSNNGTGNQGEVDHLDQAWLAQATVVPGNNEGVALDHLGNLYQAGDLAVPGDVLIFARIADRPALDAFSLDLDRTIGGGAMAALLAPKGVAIAHEAGLLLVADFGSSSVAVFGTAAGGDVPPLARTALDAAPWDLVYDESADRLFVARTDGTVAVFDDYVSGGFAPGAPAIPDRVITPSDGSGTQVSINLHGIAYDAGNDRLVVSDVGDVGVSDDGAIYAFEGASAADGNVEPDRTIAGPLTLLGNPVDLALDGEELRVAEKANDLLLLFTGVFTHEGGDVAPALSQPEEGPESLVLAPIDTTVGPDTSDVDDFATALDGLLTTSNPDAGPEIGDLYRLDLDLVESASFQSGIFFLENVALDRAGDAFVTYDDGVGTSAGLLVLNRLAKGRDGEAASTSRDRAITGASTLMVAPKGVEVVDERGVVLIAESDPGAPSVLAFSSSTTGNAVPLQVTPLPAPPWDLDYDPTSDTLFVALTDGSIAVYDGYFTLPPPATPDRLITISDDAGAQESQNLHGIVHDAVNDVLIVSDVGDTGDLTDGVIYVVDTATTADGLVDPIVRIAGPATSLGNPVDLAYNGQDLFVAEKGNELVLRFNDVVVSAGGDLAPTDSEPRVAPESVCLIPSDLSPSSGGSIF